MAVHTTAFTQTHIESHTLHVQYKNTRHHTHTHTHTHTLSLSLCIALSLCLSLFLYLSLSRFQKDLCYVSLLWRGSL